MYLWFDFFAAMKVHIVTSSVEIPCRFVGKYQLLEGTRCFYLQDRIPALK
jgi:hypothetical protein